MYEKRKIGILGSIALDNIFRAESLPQKGERVFGNLLGSCIGGMAANQAVEAARYSKEIYILGTVGEDETGARIYRHLEQRGCHTERLLKSGSLPTGQTYMFLVDQNREYFSIVNPGANMAREETEIYRSLAGLDALLISLEMNTELAEKAIEYAAEHGIYTYLCMSPAENCSGNLVKKADALIGNLREAKILLGIKGETPDEIMKELCGIQIEPCKMLLISLGNQGAVLREGEQVYYAKSVEVESIDAVGAGDAFAGAFVANRENGMDSYRALCYGCIAGGFTVSVIGAQSSDHTSAKVEEFYQTYYMR